MIIIGNAELFLNYYAVSVLVIMNIENYLASVASEKLGITIETEPPLSCDENLAGVVGWFVIGTLFVIIGL